MSVEFISGKPGGGKTLFAVELIVRELVHGKRVVVTNVPLLLPELNAYLQEEHPEASVNLFERVEMLSEDDLGSFFRHRGPGRLVPEFAEGKNDGLPNYGGMTWKDVGCFYVLDEIHIAFNSRAWMKTGPGAIYYLSQHRKLSDDVIAITQSIPNVDKQFRSVAQAFHYLRNQAKETYRGFKLPKKFVRKSYLQPATGQSDTPYEVTSYKFPLKLGKVYNTAAGIGICGQSGADTKEERRGWDYRWLAVPIALVCIALFYVPDLIGKGVAGVVNADMVSFTASAPSQPSQAAPAVSGRSTVTVDRQAVPAPSWVGAVDRQAADAVSERVNGMVGNRFSVTWLPEGWYSFEEAADTEEHRAMLVKFAGWRPRPQLSRAVVAATPAVAVQRDGGPGF